MLNDAYCPSKERNDGRGLTLADAAIRVGLSSHKSPFSVELARLRFRTHHSSRSDGLIGVNVGMDCVFEVGEKEILLSLILELGR